MDLFICIAAFLLIALPALFCAKKLSELKAETEELREKLSESEEKISDADYSQELEEAYRKGLAGIMAYSLTEAAGEDEL